MHFKPNNHVKEEFNLQFSDWFTLLLKPISIFSQDVQRDGS